MMWFFSLATDRTMLCKFVITYYISMASLVCSVSLTALNPRPSDHSRRSLNH